MPACPTPIFTIYFIYIEIYISSGSTNFNKKDETTRKK